VVVLHLVTLCRNQNAANECALGLLTAFNTGEVTRSRKQREYFRSIISMLRQTLYETATSC